MVPLTAIDKADTGWVMVASALVLLMTLPGIALFYAGLVRPKCGQHHGGRVCGGLRGHLTWFRPGLLARSAAESPLAAAIWDEPGLPRFALRWPAQR